MGRRWSRPQRLDSASDQPPAQHNPRSRARYGPGRYDPSYEEQDVDYPLGFVRWTERNFGAVLDMMSERRLDMKPLISHRFSIAEAARVYEVVTGSAPSLGILLEYPTPAERPEATLRERTVQVKAPQTSGSNRATVGFIGAGNFATAVLIPAFKATGARLRSVASNGGVSGLHAAKKFGFELTTTDTPSLLVLSETGGASSRILMVGFNRRFAPQVQKIRELLAECVSQRPS